MNKKEHLLTILSEECNEVAQRVSKALRFGMSEVQPEQELTNAERIAYEMADLVAVYNMLVDEEILHAPSVFHMETKKLKVEEFLEYSKEQKTLTK